MLHSLLLFIFTVASISAPTDLAESPFGPELSKLDVQMVMRQYKDKILKETTPLDTIIFVGNSASYFYYLFNESDKRNCHLVPISASRYDNKNLLINEIINLAEILFGNPDALWTSSTTTLEERTKGFCESFIDPLQLDKPPSLPETSKKGPLKKLLKAFTRSPPTGRIVLVDFSSSGDSVNGFLRLIKSCVSKTYNPKTVDLRVGLPQPLVFLNILSDKHLGLKATHWDPSNNFGFNELKDVIVGGRVAEDVVEYLRSAERYRVPRLLPSYDANLWKLTKAASDEVVQDFQKDSKVQTLISKLKEIGRVN